MALNVDPVDLDALLIRTDNMTSTHAAELAREHYEGLYVSKVILTHDGQRVWFFSNRFEHAFQRDSKCQGGPKDAIDFNRVQRVLWIGEVIQGNVSGSTCRSMPDKDSRRRDSRLYMIDSECYVVWLSPRGTDEWIFSTAYKAFSFQMKKHRDEVSRIWSRK